MSEINGKLSESRVLRCHFYQIGDICWILITVGDLIRTWLGLDDVFGILVAEAFVWKVHVGGNFGLSMRYCLPVTNISNVSSTIFVSNLVIWSFGNDLWHYRSMRFFSKTFLIGTHLSSKLTWSDLRTIQFQNLQFKFNDFQSFWHWLIFEILSWLIFTRFWLLKLVEFGLKWPKTFIFDLLKWLNTVADSSFLRKRRFRIRMMFVIQRDTVVQERFILFRLSDSILL